MKKLSIVLPFLIYGLSFYILFNLYSSSDYQLSNTLFTSGIILVVLYLFQFARKGGFSFGLTNQTYQRIQAQAAVDSLIKNQEIKHVQQRDPYRKKSIREMLPYSIYVILFGIISIIVSLFTY